MSKFLVGFLTTAFVTSVNAFGQNKVDATQTNQSVQVPKNAPGWVRMCMDPELGGQWKTLESAFQAALAFGQISPAEDKSRFSMGLDSGKGLAITPKLIEKRYGPPQGKVQDPKGVWLDYDAIRLLVKTGEDTVSLMDAEFCLYKYGFWKIAENTLKAHAKPSIGETDKQTAPAQQSK